MVGRRQIWRFKANILQQAKLNSKNFNHDVWWAAGTFGGLMLIKLNNKNFTHDVWWAAGTFGGLKLIFYNKSNEIARGLLMMCGRPPAACTDCSTFIVVL